MIEKERQNAISVERFSISQSLLRTQQFLEEARLSSEARVQATESARSKELVRDRASREQRHRSSSVTSRSGRTWFEIELAWTFRLLKHSPTANVRRGIRLVRMRSATTRSGTRRGRRLSHFPRGNRRRLSGQRWLRSSLCRLSIYENVVSCSAALHAIVTDRFAACHRSAGRFCLTLCTTGRSSRRCERRPGLCHRSPVLLTRFPSLSTNVLGSVRGGPVVRHLRPHPVAPGPGAGQSKLYWLT
jgi:hypothetical protein